MTALTDHRPSASLAQSLLERLDIAVLQRKSHTYLRRLLSHDGLNPKQLALHSLRRRQSMLFDLVWVRGHLQQWKLSHPEGARCCDEIGWKTLPIFDGSFEKLAPSPHIQRANFWRVLSWWQLSISTPVLYAGMSEEIRTAVPPASPMRPSSLGTILTGNVASLERSLSAASPPEPTALMVLESSLAALAQSPLATLFRGPIINCLKSPSNSILAAQCPMGGFHVLSDLFFLEEHPDEKDSTLLTDLDQREHQSLRFRLPRALPLADSSCNCGRSFPLLEF